MKAKLLILLLLPFQLLFAEHAENSNLRQGKIESKQCPFSCKTKGLSKRYCRDWQYNQRCFVEDLRKKPHPYRHGRTLKKQCPFSCKNLGLSKTYCRDWKEDGMCVVEDLSLKRNSFPIKTKTTKTDDYWDEYWDSQSLYHNEREFCRTAPRHAFASNQIVINKSEYSSKFFGPYIDVNGIIKGRCIMEAGYYENGQLIKKFRVELTPNFQSKEFNVRVRQDRQPEVRIYSIHGDRFVQSIAPDVERE